MLFATETLVVQSDFFPFSIESFEMFKKVSSCFAVVLVAVASVAVIADELNLKDVKCVVADKDANPSKSAAYKDGTVYFCCGGCQGKFSKDQKSFATRANHQLVATKQYVQKSCPFSGKPVDSAVTTTVSGVDVGLCCNGCKSKVEKAKPEKQVELVFADKPFTIAFAKPEAENQ
jgi:hypothetical protein